MTDRNSGNEIAGEVVRWLFDGGRFIRPSVADLP
jgi:hypothetical protein